MSNGFSLIATGGGNPSPVYAPELSRFNGWPRQLSTLVRLPIRGRVLDHVAHTPALPLAGRSIPDMAHHQIAAMPHQIIIETHTSALSTSWQNSQRLPIPCLLTNMRWWGTSNLGLPFIQVALSPNPVTTDAAMLACALIFKSQGLWVDPIQAVGTTTNPTPQFTLPFDLNIPITTPQRSIITVRTQTTQDEVFIGFVSFHIQPL